MAHRDPRTIAYLERRTAEGLSKRDIIRCLKRYVAREVFTVVVAPPEPAPTGPEIRSLRNEAGLTQTQLAATVELTLMQVS
ncbi:MAG: hypothetical protein WEB55_02590 [Acidimicrobiia bacterium]